MKKLSYKAEEKEQKTNEKMKLRNSPSKNESYGAKETPDFKFNSVLDQSEINEIID